LDRFDPYHRWLGIRPEDQPPNHYRLLGLSLWESDCEVIRDAADRQMAHVRTYQLGPNSAQSQRVLNELGAATACLLDPQKRADYDAILRHEMDSTQRPPEPPSPSPPLPPSPLPRLAPKQHSLNWLAVLAAGGAALLCLTTLVAGVKLLGRNEKQVADSAGKTVAATDEILPSTTNQLPQPKPAATAPPTALEPPVNSHKPTKAAEPLAPLEKPAPKEIAVELGNGVKLEMVLIPAGSFMMGDDTSGDVRPAHHVKITKPFYLGRYLVRQEQWEAVMANNPSHFKGPKNPVERVSWDDCRAFVGKFVLPSEAQWDYACRAGSKTLYCFGDDEKMKSNWANMGGTIRTPRARRTRWARSSRTPGGCTTCTGTCGSCARTGMIAGTTRIPRWTTRRGLRVARTACYAAVAGAAGRGSAGRRTVAAPSPGAVATPWASVSPEARSKQGDQAEPERTPWRRPNAERGRRRASSGEANNKKARCSRGWAKPSEMRRSPYSLQPPARISGFASRHC